MSREQEIVTLYSGGLPVVEVSKKAGVSRTTVLRHLKKAGVKLRSKQRIFDGLPSWKRWRQKNPELNYVKNKRHSLNRFGLSLEDYNRMLISQEGLCLICKGPPRTRNVLFVDHCHKTNKIRGLLCDWCNKALGFFEDDVNRVKEAVKYLTAFA